MQSLLGFQEKIPPSSLVLGSPVKHIERGSNILSGRPGCKVTLTSGAIIEAEHVIFTPCLGVLKDLASEMFSPPLPDKKMKSIEVSGGYEYINFYLECVSLSDLLYLKALCVHHY